MINNNNVSALALLEIKNNNEKAKATANNNLNTALSNKKFAEAYKTARSLQFELAKLEYENKNTKSLTEQLNKTYNILRNELKKLKLSPKDFKPNYSCKKCSDTGFVDGNECDCLKSKKFEIILKHNSLDKNNLHNFDDVNFDVFDKTCVAQVKDIYKLARSFTELENTKKLNFIMFGNTGVGKTYLSECMLSSAINNNKYALLTTSFNLTEVFIKYHIASLEDKNEILNPYLTCDMLIIDDLGSEKVLNNITREYLYIILSERTKNNLKTVITTNLAPDAIMEVYDERIFSRLINKRDNILVNFDGVDLRLKK